MKKKRTKKKNKKKRKYIWWILQRTSVWYLVHGLNLHLVDGALSVGDHVGDVVVVGLLVGGGSLQQLLARQRGGGRGGGGGGTSSSSTSSCCSTSNSSTCRSGSTGHHRARSSTSSFGSGRLDCRPRCGACPEAQSSCGGVGHGKRGKANTVRAFNLVSDVLYKYKHKQ
jgi:hypothetical protein